MSIHKIIAYPNLNFFSLIFFLLAIFQKNIMSAQSLLINEIQVANIDQFIDPSYNYGGWIELYNPTSKEIRLVNYSLRHTDDEGNVEEYTLTWNHGNTAAKGYSVLWFDHTRKDGYFGPNTGNQIPFKLDSDGGVLELLNPNGELVDAIAYPQSIARSSYQREIDGESTWGWSSKATPGQSNNENVLSTERLDAPVVSTSGGLFRNEYHFSVRIPHDATLHYTTDGSVPLIDTANVSSDGYFCGNDNTIYRFVLSKDGFLNSPVVTRSFIRDTCGYCLPILSVSTAPKNLFDDTIGLYVRGTNGRIANNSGTEANLNMDWERPVNVELFIPDTLRQYVECINQEASFSIFGGWTRFNSGNENFEYRSSFKLKSDKVFEGINTFSYPIFESKPYIKIKNFLVRNGGRILRPVFGMLHFRS